MIASALPSTDGAVGELVQPRQLDPDPVVVVVVLRPARARRGRHRAVERRQRARERSFRGPRVVRVQIGVQAHQPRLEFRAETTRPYRGCSRSPCSPSPPAPGRTATGRRTVRPRTAPSPACSSAAASPGRPPAPGPGCPAGSACGASSSWPQCARWYLRLRGRIRRHAGSTTGGWRRADRAIWPRGRHRRHWRWPPAGRTWPRRCTSASAGEREPSAASRWIDARRRSGCTGQDTVG